MGLMDQLGQAAGGMFGTESGNADPLMQVMVGLMTKNSSVGGLDGLVQTFQRNGLSDIVNSWVGTGQNLPISPAQVKQGLGADAVSQLATKAGVSPDTLSSKLAHLLPELIDKLTPGGKIPDGGLVEQGLNLLKGKLG
jgi:uncharacterized protein YidB (DUF937 family)